MERFFERLTKVRNEKELPVITIKDVVLFPHVTTSLFVQKGISRDAVLEALSKNKQAIILTQKNKEVEVPTTEDLYKIGTVIQMSKSRELPDQTLQLVIEGKSRARVLDFTQKKPYLKALVEEFKEYPSITPEIQALFHSVVEGFKQSVSLGKTVPVEVLVAILDLSDPVITTDIISFTTEIGTKEKQDLLETFDFKERLIKLNKYLVKERAVLEEARKIQTKTAKELEKMQKEVYLREEMKTIQKELGIEEDEETRNLRRKIEEAKMPDYARKAAESELDKLKRTPPFSPEISWIRSYLDLLVSLPWSKESKDQINLKEAKKILDQDHYGLEKVKERILEYLAVLKLVGRIRGSILCFVGPPGTGKTSVGKSIAKAMNRKFVRMSLGGIRDEAEIRGHRRTYVGALPGRIIQGVKNAGTRNPVFMLDEIDKVGVDFRGDPSAALLEILDPEQNNAFSDNYVEIPFDLSDVLFITTANILETIPPTLLDRMEIIRFPGYIEDEKIQIAQKFLVPKLLKSHGLSEKEVKIEKEALSNIISKYTREAGVRNLEREIATIFRKVAKEISENGRKETVDITVKNLSEYLGPAKFALPVAEEKDEVGVATGLAWTVAGGQVLFIEATPMKGKGNLILTGKLGEIMKESAQAALSYARSKAEKLGINPEFYKQTDIHVHVPEGAIPKDGPSAGIAIATSIISSLIKRPIKRGVGMTGEITLRGRVLEVGGVKEKVLAAQAAGVETVILPKNNKKDMIEVPEQTKKSLKFVFVSSMDEVLKEALADKK
ncbi:MAG: endopeptidase La [Patescibacteria group bacterium]|nr:endopeptidase La [Patescibacteria group bacterium]